MWRAVPVFALGVAPSLIHPSAVTPWHSSTVLGRPAIGHGVWRGRLHRTVGLLGGAGPVMHLRSL